MFQIIRHSSLLRGTATHRGRERMPHQELAGLHRVDLLHTILLQCPGAAPTACVVACGDGVIITLVAYRFVQACGTGGICFRYPSVCSPRVVPFGQSYRPSSGWTSPVPEAAYATVNVSLLYSENGNYQDMPLWRTCICQGDLDSLSRSTHGCGTPLLSSQDTCGWSRGHCLSITLSCLYFALHEILLYVRTLQADIHILCFLVFIHKINGCLFIYTPKLGI